MKFVNKAIETSNNEIIMTFNIGENDICNFNFGQLIVLHIDLNNSSDKVETMLDIYKDLPTIFDLVNILDAEKISYKINRYRDGLELDKTSVKEYVKPVEEVKPEPQELTVSREEVQENKVEEPKEEKVVRENKPKSKYNFDINDEDFESKPKGKKKNRNFNKNINNQQRNNNDNRRFNNNNDRVSNNINRDTGRPLSRCEQMEAMRKSYINGGVNNNNNFNKRPYEAEEVMRKYQKESLDRMTTEKMKPDERFGDIMKYQKDKEKFNKEYQDRMIERYNSMMKYIK